MGQIKISSVLISTLIAASALGQADNATLQGFTQEGIASLNAAMHKWVDGGKGANMVTLLARHGQIVNHDAHGFLSTSDKSERNKVKKDSIYNIMSMTKPITGVAMMMFYEEGKFKLDDPVSKHIPEFANLKVKTNAGVAPQKTPMTMAQLMSHSAGFPGTMLATGTTLKAGVEGFAKSNLAFQPGTGWRYGPGVEIQGYLMEKWAGKDISDILQERLLKPLGMVDTGFWVPAEKRSRVVPSSMAPPKSKPTRLIPSYGIHSTAEDYWRICQMLLNGGEFKGKRYLKEETVKLMQTNVLEMDKGVYVNFMGGGKGIGFGLDFAVVVDPTPTKNYMPKASFYWGGAFGTWFWIDPTNDIVFVGMITSMGQGLSGDGTLRQTSAKAIYESLHR
jgi:CubicO group peptidase (beta-lactamase class C family)